MSGALNPVRAEPSRGTCPLARPSTLLGANGLVWAKKLLPLQGRGTIAQRWWRGDALYLPGTPLRHPLRGRHLPRRGRSSRPALITEVGG